MIRSATFALSLALIASVACMSGCMHSRYRTAESKAYVNGQLSAIEKQKPIVEFIAAEGQQITLGGVKEFRVYAPQDTKIQALPQQRSAWADIGLRLIDRGSQVAGFKFASDTLTSVFGKFADQAGDHSTTTTNITDSYNDSSDHSTHGDTITGSNLIGGDVSGPGAGIGTSLDQSTDVSGDGSAVGDGNELINGANANNQGTIRQESDGPYEDDHSDDGDDCTGNCDTNPEPEPVEPETTKTPVESEKDKG